MIKQLSESFGISGDERQIRDFIINTLTDYNIEFKVDPIGNLFARTFRDGLPTVILAAHMDEPGFIITDITDDGYLKFDTIGDIDASALLSQSVKIGDVAGIISFKAIHLTTKEEREKPVKVKDLFIDIGADSKKEAEEEVLIGDYGVFATDFSQFGENSIKGKALSSRAGCGILINLLKRAYEFNVNLICVFTAQREVASRGARVAFESLPVADVAIVIDGVPCDDAIKSGDGAVIGFFADMNEKSRHISNRLLDLSKQKNAKIQTVAASKGDRDAITLKRTDIPSVFIGIPCKYKNTAVNIMNNDDIDAVGELIAELILRGSDNGFDL